MTMHSHKLDPTDDTDDRTVEVTVVTYEGDEVLIASDDVEMILGLWKDQGDAEREWIRTISDDYVLATWDGSDLMLDGWSESGDGTYYLNEAPTR